MAGFGCSPRECPHVWVSSLPSTDNTRSWPNITFRRQDSRELGQRGLFLLPRNLTDANFAQRVASLPSIAIGIPSDVGIPPLVHRCTSNRATGGGTLDF